MTHPFKGVKVPKIARVLPPCKSCDHLSCEMQREERKPANCDKNLEIEKIKRLLHNLIDRVEQLKTR